MQSLGTILGVWAHPDDETYLSAGLMAAAKQAGQRVVCITATRGEGGSLDEAKWPSQRLALIREQELLDSLKILGIDEHHFLVYADGGCDQVPLDEGAQRILRFLHEIQPDSVLTFGPDGLTGHTDHQAVSAWTTAAFRRWANPEATLYYAATTPEWSADYRPKFAAVNAFYGAEYPIVVPAGQLAIDFALEPSLLDQKAAALAAQASQMVGVLRVFGGLAVVREAFACEMFRIAEAGAKL